MNSVTIILRRKDWTVRFLPRSGVPYILFSRVDAIKFHHKTKVLLRGQEERARGEDNNLDTIIMTINQQVQQAGASLASKSPAGPAGRSATAGHVGPAGQLGRVRNFVTRQRRERWWGVVSHTPERSWPKDRQKIGGAESGIGREGFEIRVGMGGKRE